MSKIESPLGKKSFSSNMGGQRKVLTVSDDDFEDPYAMTGPAQQPGPPPPMQQPMQKSVQLTPEQFKELQAHRNELRSGQKKATPESKLRAEILCGIGRLQTETEADGHKFVLQSLKSGEMKEVFVAVAAAPNAAMFEMRTHVLARSLVSVDDQPIELILGTSGLDDVLDFINELQESLVDRLYKAYTGMTKEHDDKFRVKDEQDAHEVAHEIKK